MEHVLAIARQSHCLVPSFVLYEAYHALLVLISCQLVWAEFSFLELLQKGRSCGLPVTVVCLPVDPDESGQKEQRDRGDAAALAHGPVSDDYHEKNTLGELSCNIWVAALLPIPPKYYVAIN